MSLIPLLVIIIVFDLLIAFWNYNLYVDQKSDFRNITILYQNYEMYNYMF